MTSQRPSAGDMSQFLQLPTRRWIPNGSRRSIGVGFLATFTILFVLLPFKEAPIGAFFLNRGITQPITLAIALIVGHYCADRLIRSINERKLVDRDWIPQGIVDLRPADNEVQLLVSLIASRKTLIANRLARLLICYRDSGSRSVTRELHQDDCALTQSDIEDSFIVTRTMIWSLPMLGFLGTVLGISFSISGFAGLLTNVTNLEKVKSGLTQVTGGLSTAFDTTLLGIVCAITCMVLMSIAERSEYRLAGDLESGINDALFPRLSEDDDA